MVRDRFRAMGTTVELALAAAAGLGGRWGVPATLVARDGTLTTAGGLRLR